MSRRIADLEDQVENLEMHPFLIERKEGLRTDGKMLTAEEAVAMLGFGDLLDRDS